MGAPGTVRARQHLRGGLGRQSTDLPPSGAADTESFYIARPGFVAVSYTLERLRGQWRVVNRVERP